MIHSLYQQDSFPLLQVNKKEKQAKKAFGIKSHHFWPFAHTLNRTRGLKSEQNRPGLFYTPLYKWQYHCNWPWNTCSIAGTLYFLVPRTWARVHAGFLAECPRDQKLWSWCIQVSSWAILPDLLQWDSSRTAKDPLDKRENVFTEWAKSSANPSSVLARTLLFNGHDDRVHNPTFRPALQHGAFKLFLVDA